MRIEDEIQQSKSISGKGKAIINVLVTADRISSRINGALKPLGISKEQYNVLRILRGQSPIPCALQVVSGRMISQSSNASRLVDKLVSRGLVERRLCESNRRKVDILITEPGLDLLAQGPGRITGTLVEIDVGVIALDFGWASGHRI